MPQLHRMNCQYFTLLLLAGMAALAKECFVSGLDDFSQAILSRWNRMDRRNRLSGGSLWRGVSDRTMTRMREATGEALLVPPRNRRSIKPNNFDRPVRG